MSSEEYCILKKHQGQEASMHSQKAIIPPQTVLTPRLCKAARALLGWRQEDLAEASGVGLGLIRHFEAEARVLKLVYVLAMERALTDAGLEFYRGGVVIRELEAA
jgi:hypothetical protein